MQPHHFVFIGALLFFLGMVLLGYSLFALKQARVVLARAEAIGARATQVFQDAQQFRNETRRLQENIATLLPEETHVPTLAEVPILGLATSEDLELGDLMWTDPPLPEPEPEPELDYENFQGLPVKENTPEGVMDSLRAHGFIVRFNQPAVEVQIAYQKPDTANDPVRATYRAPAEIFPLNNLHEAGKAATALWAAKRFVAQYKFPEFQNYPYL